MMPTVTPLSCSLHRLLRLVDGMLDDPDLTPGAVAAAAGISTRHLHRLFAAAGLRFADHVRRTRLERCRAALSDPGQGGRTLIDIAFSWGFNDAAHFSRSFRAAYGTTPRAWRAASVVEGGRIAA